MRIVELWDLEDKRGHMSLLLSAEQSEEMVMRYLSRGRMFLLEEEHQQQNNAMPVIETLGEIVVIDYGEGKCEIKSLAVTPNKRRKGYGRMLIEHAAAIFADSCSEMTVGTDGQGIRFYERCGFSLCHITPGLFADSYPESGGRYADMYYMHRKMQPYSSLAIHCVKRHRPVKSRFSSQLATRAL